MGELGGKFRAGRNLQENLRQIDARRLTIEGKSAKEIALIFKVHPTTIYRLPMLEA